MPRSQQQGFPVPNPISNNVVVQATQPPVQQLYGIPSNASSSSLVDLHMNPEVHEAGYEEDDEEDFDTLLPRSSRKPFFEQQLELELKIKEESQDINNTAVEDEDVHVNWEEDDGFEEGQTDETKENIFKQIDSENEESKDSSVPIKEEKLEPLFEKQPEQVSQPQHQQERDHEDDHFMETAARSPPHFEDAYSMSKDLQYSTYSESEDHHSTSSQMNDTSSAYYMQMLENDFPQSKQQELLSNSSHTEMMDISSGYQQQPLTSALLEAAATVAPSLSISTINAEINKNKSRKKSSTKSPVDDIDSGDVIKGGGVAHKRHIETEDFLDDSETNPTSCSKIVLIEFKSLRDKEYLKNKLPDILYTLTWKHKYDLRITSSQPIFSRISQENVIRCIILDIVMADTLDTASYDKTKAEEKHKYSRKKSQQDILSASSSTLDIPSCSDSMMVSSSSDSSAATSSKRKVQELPQNGETIKIAKIKKENDREIKITLGIHPTYCSKRFSYAPFRMKIEFDEKQALMSSQIQQMRLAGLEPLHFVKYSTKFQTFAKKLSSDDVTSNASTPATASNTEMSEEDGASRASHQQQRQGRSRSKSPSVKRQRSPSLSKVPQNVEPPNQMLHQTLHQTPSSSVLDNSLTQQHHFVTDMLSQPVNSIQVATTPANFTPYGIGNIQPQMIFQNNPFFMTPNGNPLTFPFLSQSAPFLLAPHQPLPPQPMMPFNYNAMLPTGSIAPSNTMHMNGLGFSYSKPTSSADMQDLDSYNDDHPNIMTPNNTASTNAGYFSPSSFLQNNSTPLPPNTPPFTPSSILSPSLLRDIENLQQSPAQHPYL